MKTLREAIKEIDLNKLADSVDEIKPRSFFFEGSFSLIEMIDPETDNKIQVQVKITREEEDFFEKSEMTFNQ